MPSVQNSVPTGPAGGVQSWSRHVPTALLLAASTVVFAWSAARALEVEPLFPRPELTEITDAKRLSARQHDVLGTFATGKRPGDRVITVEPSGRIRFQLLGPLSLSSTDTYRMALRGQQSILITPHSGAVEVLDIDHVAYCGDTYARAKPP